MTKLILIVDLEATCWAGNVAGLDRKQTVQDMEIIEFGCVIAKFDGQVIDAKSFMVRPQLRPQLSDFCTQLTSISQQDVNAAPTYIDVIAQINAWLASYPLSAWGSWGLYDHNQITAEQQRYACAPIFFQLPHLNIKHLWRVGKMPSKQANLANALKYHQLEFVGTAHRGIDDALNIARLLAFIHYPHHELPLNYD